MRRPIATPVFLAFALLAAWFITATAAAQTENTIVTFPDGTVTTNPFTLIPDGHGNYFGTAIGGPGSVFEMSPNGSGGWQVTTIYEFPGTNSPWNPEGIVMDAAGNIYGACAGGLSYGSIFELSPDGNGGWMEKMIYEFRGPNGREPLGTLLLDASGNLYGTTNAGGSCTSESVGCGIAYKLTPQSSGKWKETILHRFGASSGDGEFPSGGLALDSNGNLYGTTQGGGLTGCPNQNVTCGTVFELSPTSTGWKEQILHRFNNKDGAFPWDTPTLDAAGNIYGTAYEGGAALFGTVFKLSPTGTGSWQIHLIHQFGSFATGAFPVGSVVLSPNGTLYAATQDGGQLKEPCYTGSAAEGCGSVWEFTPTASGGWNSKLLYVFSGGSDGRMLNDLNLVLEPNGSLLGAASYGGDSNGDGTIFEIIP